MPPSRPAISNESPVGKSSRSRALTTIDRSRGIGRNWHATVVPYGNRAFRPAMGPHPHAAKPVLRPTTALLMASHIDRKSLI
jgi:hypothetical protein